MTDPFNDLHASLIPILRYTLATTRLPHEDWVLDLASGAGGKLPLLAEAFGPGVRFIALDNLKYSEEPAYPCTRLLAHPLTADAHALPLRDGCIAAVCCIAALGLFDDPAQALAEMRRVLRPSGAVFIVTSAQCWVQTTRWPADLAAQIGAAYAAALHNGARPLFAPDVGDDLVAAMHTANFDTLLVRALLLDAPTPAEAETTLLPWPTLRSLIAPHIDAALLARCDAEAEHDIELCALALVAINWRQDDKMKR